MNKIVRKEINFAGRPLVLETGELAIQANLAVKASYGDTVVLVTVVSGAPKEDIDFFPLTVNYEEKLYAAGQIKSSRFVKRDGKATDEAVITKRLVDHAIRPLFPKDFMDEVQVVATVLSLDHSADPAFLTMIAASAALHASDIPWNGPMVSARMGFMGGQFALNPDPQKLEDLTPDNQMDMMISFSGKEKKFLAVEAEVHLMAEEMVLGAMEFARNGLDPVVSLIEDFAKEVNPKAEKYVYVSKACAEDLLKDVLDVAHGRFVDLLKSDADKVELKAKEEELKAEVLAKFEGKYKKSDMLRAFDELEKRAIQHLILEEGKRPDGRGVKEIRPITTKVNILPRTHGSGLFTRGVTQVLTVATLGSPAMELFVQDMYGEKTKRYIHYYNFPPYANGETGRMGGAGSREIGHGMLAEKALKAVIPSQDEFPYMIILVSETLSSSGSSSMASACGSSLALMDAGVPIKDVVGGVGVGLITNDDFTKYKIMTDLAYKEDAYGFLDFKMTGTRTGVTAMQADMKLTGIPFEMLAEIMAQSREARMKVLDEMEKALAKPRATVSERAPKVASSNIPPEKIGMVIGSGGKVIKEIQETTQTEVFLEDNGRVVITGIEMANVERAMKIVMGIVKDVEVGEIYEGTVKEILDFGAIIEILPGKTGLMHVSEISFDFVDNVRGLFKEGDVVRVKVIGLGDDGKISLSKKALETPPDGVTYMPSSGPSRGGSRGGGFDRGGPPRGGRGGFDRGGGHDRGDRSGFNRGSGRGR